MFRAMLEAGRRISCTPAPTPPPRMRSFPSRVRSPYAGEDGYTPHMPLAILPGHEPLDEYGLALRGRRRTNHPYRLPCIGFDQVDDLDTAVNRISMLRAEVLEGGRGLAWAGGGRIDLGNGG